MARPLRLQVTGGWYHLTARGNDRRPIFRRPGDYEAFLELLGQVEERFGLRVVAYALMPNHYHLMAILTRPDLSRAMQWLNLSYGAWFNTKYQRAGHLFQGRFHSVLIEDEGAWALEASEYVHLNPVRVAALGLDKKERAAERVGALPAPSPAQLAERLRVLRTYPWSSYRALAGLAKPPPWLAVDELLERAGDARAYRNRVEALLGQDEREPLRSRLQMGIAFGSESFSEKLKSMAADAGVPRREHRSRRQMLTAVGLGDIVRIVEKLKGEPLAAFERRYGDDGRDLIWWAARRYLGLPLSQLASTFGGVDYSTVSAAVGRLSHRAAKDEDLARRMKIIHKQLSNPKT